MTDTSAQDSGNLPVTAPKTGVRTLGAAIESFRRGGAALGMRPAE